MLELLVCQTKQGEKYVITGDVDFENVSKKQVLSVPGGVGPYDYNDVVKKTRCWQEK
jgi:5,10-methylene-tetrahydrofolate dehydrogenase/methenyl tetrahydrofolate cyclohydrolase